MPRPVWFITGGTSGLGAAVTRAALERGFHVAATSRTPDSFESLDLPERDELLPLRLDLSDAASIREAVATAEQHFGRIDVLFNNAGGVTVGAIEELSDELLWAQLQVNVAGPLATVRAVLPTMRQRASGRILQMSSLGGAPRFPVWGPTTPANSRSRARRSLSPKRSSPSGSPSRSLSLATSARRRCRRRD